MASVVTIERRTNFVAVAEEVPSTREVEGLSAV